MNPISSVAFGASITSGYYMDVVFAAPAFERMRIPLTLTQVRGLEVRKTVTTRDFGVMDIYIYPSLSAVTVIRNVNGRRRRYQVSASEVDPVFTQAMNDRSSVYTPGPNGMRRQVADPLDDLRLQQPRSPRPRGVPEGALISEYITRPKLKRKLPGWF
jgi:hypothetical protein